MCRLINLSYLTCRFHGPLADVLGQESHDVRSATSGSSRRQRTSGHVAHVEEEGRDTQQQHGGTGRCVGLEGERWWKLVPESLFENYKSSELRAYCGWPPIKALKYVYFSSPATLSQAGISQARSITYIFIQDVSQ